MAKGPFQKSVKNATAKPTPAQKKYYKTLTGKDLPDGTNRGEASEEIQKALAANGGQKPASRAKKASAPKPKAPPKAAGWPPKQATMPRECAPFKHLIPLVTDDDIRVFKRREPSWKQCLDAEADRDPAVYIGEAGTGKTTTPKAMAFIRNVPFLPLSAHSKMNSDAIFGQVNIKNGTSFHVEGMFTKLSQIPSRIHLAEVNALDPGAAMVWKSINNERQFFVQEADHGKGRLYDLHKDCYISFDLNPPSAKYNGTQRSNVADIDRLRAIQFGAWTMSEVAELLDGLPMAAELAAFSVDAVEVVAKNGIRGVISIRGLKRAAGMIRDGYTNEAAMDLGILNQIGLTAGQAGREVVAEIARRAGL